VNNWLNFFEALLITRGSQSMELILRDRDALRRAVIASASQSSEYGYRIGVEETMDGCYTRSYA